MLPPLVASLEPSFGAGIWALVKPTNPLEFWAMALVLATAGLVGVAGRGLRSLSLTRTEMRNRATRESAQCAIDRCDEMARELVPLYTEILAGLAVRQVPLFVSEASQVSFEGKEEVQKINSAIAWMGKLDVDLRNKTVQLMNALEWWSMAFTHYSPTGESILRAARSRTS